MLRGFLGGRKFLLLTLCLLLVVGLLSGCAPKRAEKPGGDQGSGTPPAEEKEPYVIGIAFAETGGASSLGEPERLTADMIAKQINDAGGINGRELKFVAYDTQSDETQAVLAIKKLIEQDKVLAVVGGTTSGESMGMLNVAEENETPFVSVAAAITIVEPVKKWVFKTAQTDRLALGTIIEGYIKPNGFKNIAWASVNYAYGDSGRVEFEKLAPENGLTGVADERFGRDDTDMTTQLTKIKGTNPDALLVWSIPPSASIITKNYGDLDLSGRFPMIQSHGIGNMTYIEQSGTASNGVVFPAGKLLVADILPDSDPQKQTLVQYKADYEAFANKPASTFGGHGWDGIMMVVEALKNGAETREEIRDYLEGLTNFVGISGVFNMSADDHMGLDPSAMAMIEIKDGKWTLYQK